MMEKPNIAKGYNKSITKMELKNEWNIVADKLNRLGPPFREGEGWQKVWSDMKFKIKKKLIDNKQRSEEGKHSIHILSRLDETVARFMSFDKLLNPQGTSFGAAPLPSAAFYRLSPSQTTNLPLIPSTSVVELCPSRSDTSTAASASNVIEETPCSILSADISKQKSSDLCTAVLKSVPKLIQTCEFKNETPKIEKESKEALLARQINIQDDLYKEVKRSLRRIESYMKRTEKNQRKMLKLEQARLILYKEELQKNEAHRIEENKLKMDELEIQRKILEIKTKKLELIAGNKL